MNESITYIFLDANFILVPAQLKVDIYSEFESLVPKPYRLVVLSAIFDELERKIENRKYKSQLKREYHLSRQILDRRSYILLEKKRSEDALVDDLLLSTAINCSKKGNKVYLATNDKELRKKSKVAGIETVFIRQNKRLDTE